MRADSKSHFFLKPVRWSLAPPDDGLSYFTTMSNPKEDYAKKLKHPKWQKKRLQILNRDKFTCKLCGDTETTLHVHHKYYEDGCDPWEYPNTALVTLCEHCHVEVESKKEDIDDFDDIRIFKSNNWKGGNRIMFTANAGDGITCMRVFDKNDNVVIGFNLPPDEQKNIAKAFKFALR